MWYPCSQRRSAYSQHDLGAPSATVGGAGFLSRSDGYVHVKDTDSRHVKPKIIENRPRGGSQRRWGAGGRFLAGARRRRILVILGATHRRVHGVHGTIGRARDVPSLSEQLSQE